MGRFKSEWQSIEVKPEAKPVTRKEYQILVDYTTELARVINELNARLEELENTEIKL